jgi:hypothetical protein
MEHSGMKRAIIPLFLVLAACGAAAQDQVSVADLGRLFLGKAADKPPQACVDKLVAAMANPPHGGAADDFTKLLDTSTSPLCATYLILSSKQFEAANSASGGKLLADAEKTFAPQALSLLKAIAQQNGTGTGTGGSTSLTAKGLTSKLLSVASEYGALTQSTSNDTTTVQGTLAGVPLALMQRGAMTECSTRLLAVTPCIHQNLLKWMSRTSYSVSFATLASSAVATNSNTAAGTSTAAQATSSTSTSGGVNAYSLKAVLVQGALDKSAYNDADTQISSAAAVAAVQTAQAALNANEVENAAVFIPFLKAQAAALRTTAETGNRVAVVAQWRALANQLVSALGVSVTVTPDAAANLPVLQNAVKLAIAYTSYLGTEDATGLAKMLAVPPVLSAEFDQNRPISAPENSVFRVIFQKTYKPITVTVNGAVSIYDSAQPNVPGASRLRDSEFAAELAHPFSLSIPDVTATNFTVSGAFYDQYQSSPAILNVTPGAPVDGVTFVNLPSTATQVYGRKGNIAIGQLKLTAGGGSAVTVPLSVTYSNRTELISKPTWKAQIGVSYDFDSMFAK